MLTWLKNPALVQEVGIRLPELFAERMRMQLGPQWEGFCRSLGEEPVVSVRLHPERWKGELPRERVPWCPAGYYLERRPQFTLDPWFHGGAYYVQEAASMFPEQAFRNLRLPSPALVLDLCAAPGGKSTHLLSLLSPGDLLVSNEVIRGRTAVLVENIAKWGYPNTVITCSDPARFGSLGPLFDLVVADVPCSGEGLFRKDPASLKEWSAPNAGHCSLRQKRILAEAWKCLKPGGYLLYSTCTYNPAENEENIEWLGSHPGAFPVEIPVPPEWNAETLRKGAFAGYAFYPHKTRSEGFFMAVAGKRGEPPTNPRLRSLPVRWTMAPSRLLHTLRSWILPGTGTEFLINGDCCTLFPSRWLPLLSLLEKEIALCHPGTRAATLHGDSLNPQQDLAHSLFMEHAAFPGYPLPLDLALEFLKRMTIPPGPPGKGWQWVSYREIPLGWIRNLGSRTNNYFPHERRIRMQTTGAPLPWHQTLPPPPSHAS